MKKVLLTYPSDDREGDCVYYSDGTYRYTGWKDNMLSEWKLDVESNSVMFKHPGHNWAYDRVDKEEFELLKQAMLNEIEPVLLDEEKSGK